MRKLLVLIFLLPITFLANGQGQRGDGPPKGGADIFIKGIVMDATSNTPLEYATVSVFNKKDSSLVGGGLTETDGSFTVKAKPGVLYAVIEFIGYEKHIIDPIKFDPKQLKEGNRNIDMGQISVSESSTTLDEIEVRAEKSETQFSLDKRIFNVGKDLANRGGTASEILDNVPSVTVSVEGEVSLRGSTGVRILVDGKPSNLASTENANSLRQIPANMIERVEVITNPSARYEAEGMAGIINIVLKKDKRSGFNGSIDLTGGIPEQYGLGVNLNYRKGKVNWFANYGLNYRTGPGGGTSYQELIRESDIFITDQLREMNRSGLSNSIRFGIDYYLKEKETLTGSFLYRISNDDNFTTLSYDDYVNTFSEANLLARSERTDDEKEDESGLQYSVRYRREFSSRQHTLDISVQYEDDLETENSKFNEQITGYDPIETFDINQRSNNDEGQKRWVIQLDYVKPISKDNRYEFGLYASLRNISNDYLVEELNGSTWESIEGLTNNFIYDEDVLASYFQYGDKLGKFNYQLGLRGEYSFVKTDLLQTNEVNDREYANLFPSAFLNYQFNEATAIQTSYSRRIRRPRFRSLNPFFTYSDNRNFYSGNPNLDPEFTDSYELNFLKFYDNLTLSSGLFYRHTKNVIQRIQRVNDDGTTITRPENLTTRNDMGLEVTISYSGLKWLRLDGSINAYRQQINGSNISSSFSSDAFTWDTRMTSRFTFWKSDLQLRTNYRAPRENPQGRYKSITSIDLGWSKDFLRSKQATLTLSVRDLLNSRKRRSETFGDNFLRISEFQWRARSATLTLNYRINQKKQRQRRQGGGGGEFEGGGEF